MVEFEQAVERAREIGREHGAAAASWVFDGNTSRETFERVLRGLEDGDPEVLDSLPTPDLSGEWADGYLPKQLFEDATGTDAHAEASWDNDRYQDWLSDLCDAYEIAFSEAVEAEVQRAAEYQLS